MKLSLIAAIAAAVFAAPAFAHDYKLGDLTINHPAIPAPTTRAMSAAGFLSVSNGGTEADRLVGVEAQIARKVEVHTTEHGTDGSARMVHVPSIEIPAGGEITLERGGYHVMFMGLTEALKVGTKVPGALIFEKAGRIEVEFAVEEMAAGGSGGHDHGDHGTEHKH